MNRETLIQLRQLLADLYPTVPGIRRIVHDAELEQWRIDFNAAVIDIWHAVLTEAEADTLPRCHPVHHHTSRRHHHCPGCAATS